MVQSADGGGGFAGPSLRGSEKRLGGAGQMPKELIMDLHVVCVTPGWCSISVGPLDLLSQMLVEWEETGLSLGEKSEKGAPVPPGIVPGCQALSPTFFF